MNRTGPQPLRGISGNVFQTHQPSNSRGASIGSARLQNGKLSNPGWGYGMGMASASGVQNQQSSRTNNSNLSSFAQTIGGSQNQASLDPSTGHYMAPRTYAQVLANTSTTKPTRPQGHVAENALPFIEPKQIKLPEAPTVRQQQEHLLPRSPHMHDLSIPYSQEQQPVDETQAIRPDTCKQLLTSDEPTSSEFPSLSGAPQPQPQQSQTQAIWNNTGVRGAQPAPVQRPQGQISSHPPSSQQAMNSSQQRQQQRAESQPDRQASAFPQLGADSDDLRFEDQSGINRMSRAGNHQGTEDDFPPLGGLGDVEATQSRRNGPVQGAAFTGLGGANDFGPPSQQTRNALLGRIESHPDSIGPVNTGSRYVSPTGPTSAASRSPLSSKIDDTSASQRAEHLLANSARIPPNMAQDSYITQGGGIPFRPSSNNPAQQQKPQSQTAQKETDGQLNDIPQMNDKDKWSLSGLMATIRGDYGPDQANLVLGMDLTTLGLDLNRSDNRPLHETWAGPFGDPTARPLIRDFTLPPAYSVNNVPPLASKIGNFSDETLFTIFYSNPRDVNQELAANELYNRDWRWHKKLHQWMMKAKEYGEPIMLPSMKEERGWYYFFDVNNWRRERKEFILNYEHLHHVPQTAQTL